MKYLIVADGPFLPKSIVLEAMQRKTVIALDGAADQLARYNLYPNIILGDMDSIQEIKKYEKHPEVLIVPAMDQNYTDLQKAIQFCEEKNAEEIHIICATGGRMDHDQANIRVLQTYYKPHCPLFLHTEYQSLFFVRDQQNIVIQGKDQDYCGFFGMPRATVIMHYGLLYGGKEPYELFAGHDSVANKITGTRGALIDICGEALIVHPPIFESQRKRF